MKLVTVTIGNQHHHGLPRLHRIDDHPPRVAMSLWLWSEQGNPQITFTSDGPSQVLVPDLTGVCVPLRSTAAGFTSHLR